MRRRAVLVVEYDPGHEERGRLGTTILRMPRVVPTAEIWEMALQSAGLEHVNVHVEDDSALPSPAIVFCHPVR